MAKWCGSVTAVWYFDAPDKKAAEKMLAMVIDDLSYRNYELCEIDEAEFQREASDEEKA